MPSLNFWDNIYEGSPDYYSDIDNPSRIEVTKYIAKGDTVLDLGCGIGTLKALLPDNPYTGIDYSPRATRIGGRIHTKGTFMAADARNLKELFTDNSFDVVVMRHFLENQEDWKKVLREAHRIANKKVIVVLRGNFCRETRLVEQKEDTWHWDIDQADFNEVARSMSANVSYGFVKQQVIDDAIVVIGKHLDKVVFELDDECDETSARPELLKLKERFPKLRVTLFAIPAKCSFDHIKKLQQYDWIELGVHGWFHDTEHGRATESNYWTEADANKYLQMTADMGCFAKVFRPPGWQINRETYKVLAENDYIIADHLSHDLYMEEGGRRYTTGHLMECHGHVWECNGNGIKELIEKKLNFGPNTEFLFVSEAPLGMENYLPNRYQ